jgi:hypothetical protein
MNQAKAFRALNPYLKQLSFRLLIGLKFAECDAKPSFYDITHSFARFDPSDIGALAMLGDGSCT